jgi:hypothetical protein
MHPTIAGGRTAGRSTRDLIRHSLTQCVARTPTRMRVRPERGTIDGMDRRWGPTLVAFGVLLVVVGLLTWGGALSWLGRLPGDLRFGTENVRVYIPITSMLLVSLVLSVLVTVLLGLFHR